MHYVRVDLRIECGGTEWNDNLVMGLFYALLYPVGIPLLFYGLMARQRKESKLSTPRAKLLFGFLYDAYDSLWFFEVVEMAYKLWMTAFLPFFGDSTRIQLALGSVGVYTAIILLANPYLRKGDDRLHLLLMAQTLSLITTTHTLLATNNAQYVRLWICATLMRSSHACLPLRLLNPRLTCCARFLGMMKQPTLCSLSVS